MKRAEIIKKAYDAIGKTAQDFNFQTDWCALFIDWLFTDAVPFTGNAHYSCTAQMNYWKSIGCWENGTVGISSGDIIYYDWDNSGDCDHVGIVVNVQGDAITVVEGNFGNGNWQSNHVGYRTITHSYAYVRGYAIPDYKTDTANTTPSERPKTLYSTAMIDRCYYKVEQIQNMLNVVDNSSISCDGYYGSETKNAVINYQKKRNLEVDGIAGRETITALCVDYFNV